MRHTYKGNGKGVSKELTLDGNSVFDNLQNTLLAGFPLQVPEQQAGEVCV